MPAALCLQIWDNDLFGKDDFLGEIELKLTDFIKPEAMSRDAILYRDGDTPDNDNMNLFKARRATGWIATKGFERTNPEWETTPDGLRRKKFIMAGKIEVRQLRHNCGTISHSLLTWFAGCDATPHAPCGGSQADWCSWIRYQACINITILFCHRSRSSC